MRLLQLRRLFHPRAVPPQLQLLRMTQPMVPLALLLRLRLPRLDPT
jgi:hypothetical protein